MSTINFPETREEITAWTLEHSGLASTFLLREYARTTLNDPNVLYEFAEQLLDWIDRVRSQNLATVTQNKSHPFTLAKTQGHRLTTKRHVPTYVAGVQVC